MWRRSVHSYPSPEGGGWRAKRAGWGLNSDRIHSPHPASLGYRLREASLPEGGEG